MESKEHINTNNVMSKKLKFSIIVPTRERCSTLKHCIRTILAQSFSDFELIIMDNNSEDETPEVVNSFDDDRIKYFKSRKRLSMRDNWENCLDHVNGEWLIFIGDDDGLIPDSLLLAYKIQENFPDTKAIKWPSGFNYWWPNVLVKHNRNMLYIRSGNKLRKFDAHETLKNFFNHVANEHALPMVYHGFVKTEFVMSIKKKHNPYFKAVGVDAYSGAINAYYLKDFLFTELPLSIVGVSGRSNGTATLFSGEKGKEIRQEWASEYKVNDITEAYHKDIQNLSAFHSQLTVMDCCLQLKDECSLDNEFEVNKLGVLQAMTYSLIFDPDGYDTKVRNILSIAKDWGIREDLITIPEKVVLERTTPGLSIDERGNFTGNIVIDGNLADIENVYDASRIINSITAKKIQYES